MDFAFSSNAFVRFPLADAIAAVATLGYQGIEIMADRPHAFPVDLDDSERRQIRQLLRENRLRVSNLNAFTLHAVGDTWNPSWIDPDPQRRQIRLDHTRRCLALAEELGAPHLSTEPGGPLPPGMAREEALALFRQGLGALEDEARTRGVRILIEPEPGLLLETGDDFARFYAGLDPRVFGLNFDIGHFFCVGEDPAACFSRFAPAVGHIHLEDIAADRCHHHLIPGHGAIPLAQVLEQIETAGYRGFATIELYPCQERPIRAAGSALAYLRRLTPAGNRHAGDG